MLIQDKQIAIIGGGPGGLTLARLLQLKGANVTVYEGDVDKDARVQGSPLDMHEGSGAAAIQAAKLSEEFNKHIRHGADKKVVVNELAEVMFSDHETSTNAPPEIDRGSLRKIFLESLQPGTVIWNSRFLSMQKQDEGWQLHFKDGATAYADVVIAADGANSKIRPYITASKALYSGITMLEINVPDAANRIPAIHTLLNGGKVMAFGNGHCILGGQKGDGDLGFYISFKTPEKWPVESALNYTDNAQMLAWFKEEYAGWSNIWYWLFEHAVTPFIPRSIYHMPLDQQWASLPNVTMLGDAAHVMPPFSGEGANMAMLDALELSECLTSGKYDSLQAAISAYETNMRERAAKAIRMSLENGERMHSAGALERMLKIFGIN